MRNHGPRTLHQTCFVLAGIAGFFAHPALAQQEPTLPTEPTEPRRLVLDTLDAFYSIDGDGPLLPIGDLNGDGTADLVGLRIVEAIELQFETHSGADGSLLQVLVVLGRRRARGGDCWDEVHWDAGFDANGDGTGDLIFGLTRGAPGAESGGSVTVVSGLDGEVLHFLPDSTPMTGAPPSVAFLGDLDGDGCSEFALGSSSAPYNPRPPYSSPDRRLRGSVSLRSGRDARELWNKVGEVDKTSFGARVRRLEGCDGDGLADLLVQCDRNSGQPVRVLSSSDGRTLSEIPIALGPTGPVGDMNGNGVPDFFADDQGDDSSTRMGGTRVLSSKDGQMVSRFPYPDFAGGWGTTSGIGDIDLDGFDDLALGEPTFNLELKWFPSSSPLRDALRSLSLEEALKLPSTPMSLAHDSGIVLVYSGRTKEVLFGIWGRPGSQDGLGFHTRAMADLNGDGYPELVVTGGRKAFVFLNPLGNPVLR